MPLRNTLLPEEEKKNKSLFERKLVSPVFNFLKQGITPARLALAFTLGILISVFPVFGSTTLLCFLFVFLFRVNIGAIMLANYFAYPLQFLCYLPLIRMGEFIFHAPPAPFSLSDVFYMFSQDAFDAIGMLWRSTLYAMTAWLLVSLPMGLLLYYTMKLVLDKLAFRMVVGSRKANNID
jgi:uncharacterized protein (DUF2062 family)